MRRILGHADGSDNRGWLTASLRQPSPITRQAKWHSTGSEKRGCVQVTSFRQPNEASLRHSLEFFQDSLAGDLLFAELQA